MTDFEKDTHLVQCPDCGMTALFDIIHTAGCPQDDDDDGWHSVDECDESCRDLMTCPEHGEQDRVDSYSTHGPDPYGVDVGACGCHVIGFSKDDVYVLKRVGRVLPPEPCSCN